MIVIDWFNEILRCHMHTLYPILEEILHLEHAFDWISCFHIYKERKSTIDSLSKAVTLQVLGNWKIVEKIDGNVSKYYHNSFIDSLYMDI